MPLSDRELLDGLMKAIVDHSELEYNENGRTIKVADRYSLRMLQRMEDNDRKLYNTYTTLTKLWKSDKPRPELSEDEIQKAIRNSTDVVP